MARWVRWIMSVGAVAGAIAACQSATGVRLVLSTNVPCDRVQGVAIAAGKPGETENAPPVTDSFQCDAGALGSIVAQPPGDKSAVAAFRVVLGVSKPVGQCTPDDRWAGCIIQRRELRYLVGSMLELPIVMYERCIGVACDPRSTCASSGQCVPVRIEDSSQCLPPRSCLPPGDPGLSVAPDGGTLVDGAPGDGALTSDTGTMTDAASEAGTDGAALDGASQDSGGDSSTGDGGSVSDGAASDGGDAASDGGSDSGSLDGGTPGLVGCGNSNCGVPGQVCCAGGGGNPASCVDVAALCPLPNAGRVACDQSVDCAGGNVCCFTGGGTQCQNMPCFSRVCVSNADCSMGDTCTRSVDLGNITIRQCEVSIQD
jgi:hypothetical protein